MKKTARFARCTRLSRPLVPILTALLLSSCFRPITVDFVVRVPGLNSEECFSLIQEALKPLDGLESASPDFEARTIMVRYNSEKLGQKNIEFVVAGTGFQANDLPRNEEAYAKLPEACR